MRARKLAWTVVPIALLLLGAALWLVPNPPVAIQRGFVEES